MKVVTIEKGKQGVWKTIRKRTKKFAIEIVKISSLLPQTAEAKVIKNQLTKSGTSVGANYREANRSRSKADFRNKIKICESEASETLYWLEIIDEIKWLQSKSLEAIKKESSEILQFSLLLERI